jgi:hypothetical protein
VKFKDIPWQVVVIVVAFLAAVTIIEESGKPDATLVTIGLAILGGLGILGVKQTAADEKTTVVKEQTNGMQTKMLEIIERQAQQLATMHLPPVPPPEDGKPDDWPRT